MNSAELAQRIVDAVVEQRRQLMQSGPTYCPYPVRWLAERRWEDEPVSRSTNDWWKDQMPGEVEL